MSLYEATEDERVINWLCEKSGGFFVSNTEADNGVTNPQRLAPATSVVKQFADLLSTVAEAASDSVSTCVKRPKFARNGKSSSAWPKAM